jgi:predicted signal transduction protein with EAL and GGDEF domain
VTESEGAPDAAEPARFEVSFAACPTAAVITDPAGVVVFANPAFESLVEQEAGSAVGSRLHDMVATDAGRRVLDDVVRRLHTRSGEVVREELEIMSAEAPSRPVRVSAIVLPGAGERLFYFEDLQELWQLQRTFHHQTLHDSVTGLPNDAYFRSNLESAVASAAEADQVLRAVAGTLRGVFGQDAFIARLFRDEFAVALRGKFTRQSVVELAEKMIERLAHPVYHGVIGVGVSASVGVVVADVPVADHRALTRSAEVALHRAKEMGKSQWVLSDREADREALDRYRLAASVAGAIETGDIGVVFQPHVVLPDAPVVTSLNASLCWRHPRLGPLGASEVYALAELTGMTVPLGRYLLSEALETAADWRARFGDGAPMVCVTLPQRMAIDADLVGIVRAELDRHGLEARRLMLCADSSSVLDARGDLAEAIGVLARLGVVFVMDAAGLHDLELFSALELPVPAVMLTGPIVAAVSGQDPPERSRNQIRILVERAEELGVKVGAHGVISLSHAELLHSLGVVVAAGPYLPEYASRDEAEVWAGRVFPMG